MLNPTLYLQLALAHARNSRVKNEYSTAMDGKLLHNACKETIHKNKSTVKKQMSSLKHVKAKKAIMESKKKDQSVLESTLFHILTQPKSSPSIDPSQSNFF